MDVTCKVLHSWTTCVGAFVSLAMRSDGRFEVWDRREGDATLHDSYNEAYARVGAIRQRDQETAEKERTCVTESP